MYVWEGKHFTFRHERESKTLIYQIVEMIDCVTLTKWYDFQFLDYVDKETEDGSIETTYYLDDPSDIRDMIIILSFFQKDECVYARVGEVKDTSVIISRKVEKLRWKKQPGFRMDDLSSAAYKKKYEEMDWEDEEKAEETKNEEEAVWYHANLEYGAKVIIDPVKGEPVRREVYTDSESGERKARIQLKKNHPYFAFELRRGESKKWPLTNMELADYYLKGTMGFIKDELKAAEYLEKDGSPEADYKIAQLFLNPKGRFYDKEWGMKYMRRAAERGYEEAQSCLESINPDMK